MKIAIPVWEDKVSPVLDTASRLLVVEVEAQKESSRFETYLDVKDLSGRCVRIRALGVDVLICGAISRPFLRILEASGIHTVPGIVGHPEEVLKAYLKGDLVNSKYLMPGYQSTKHMSTGESSDFGQAQAKERRKKEGSKGEKFPADAQEVAKQ